MFRAKTGVMSASLAMGCLGLVVNSAEAQYVNYYASYSAYCPPAPVYVASPAYYVASPPVVYMAPSPVYVTSYSAPRPVFCGPSYHRSVRVGYHRTAWRGGGWGGGGFRHGSGHHGSGFAFRGHRR